jgi:hypothetical protein
MIGRRNRSAWIWVAITAIALASVARAESGYEIARAYANPLIALFSADQGSQPLAAHNIAPGRTVRGDGSNSQQNGGASFWLELLPVLFVGLLSTRSLLSGQSSLSLGHVYPAPALAALFQRPPPAELL